MSTTTNHLAVLGALVLESSRPSQWHQDNDELSMLAKAASEELAANNEIDDQQYEIWEASGEPSFKLTRKLARNKNA